VTAGTLASIGGNVAHAHPDPVAQAIAAAIPLAVLAMLEGLKGDAGEVTRLAHAATNERASAGRLHGQADRPEQAPRADTVTVRRVDTPPGGTDTTLADRRVAELAAPPVHTDGLGVRQRLQAAYTQGRADGQPWTARTLAEAAGCGRSSAAAFLQRQRRPAPEGPA
jgi:hypothetical protein